MLLGFGCEGRDGLGQMGRAGLEEAGWACSFRTGQGERRRELGLVVGWAAGKEEWREASWAAREGRERRWAELGK